VLRARWLGRVPYREALDLQRGLHRHAREDHLLLLEHDHVMTLGARADPAHLLVPPATVGADVISVDRGGDVTYHGPGQLVGYPVLAVPMGSGAVPAFVASVEEVVIRSLQAVGLADVGRLPGYPGVWVNPSGAPRKIAAVGVRVSRGRSMHGFALNVRPDMAFFKYIVPCGIADLPVTSLQGEGLTTTMRQMVEAVTAAAGAVWGTAQGWESQGISWRTGKPAPAAPGVPPAPLGQPVTLAPTRGLAARMASDGLDPQSGLAISARKPEWLRRKARIGDGMLTLRHTIRELGLATVCEDAGCPNIFECWSEGTATFMINGQRCTRACGFCQVDTRRPLAVEDDEPERVARAVARMDLAHAVVTAVARDDLDDGGAAGFVATIAEIRRLRPGTAVEVLIPDCKGDTAALDAIFEAAPEVLNHNMETVARLQRVVRPSAGYARSLTVLARAKRAGLVTKSGLILGMGETSAEVEGALADLAGVGVDIVTLGQYLRPSASHLAVARWVEPAEFDRLAEVGEALGISHVEASPFTRSSYHARASAAAAGQHRQSADQVG
jgi:lipoyl synthase